MTTEQWREEFLGAGLSEEGAEHALRLVPVLQPLVDEATARLEATAPDLNTWRGTPWAAAYFLKKTIEAIALRRDVLQRFHGPRD